MNTTDGAKHSRGNVMSGRHALVAPRRAITAGTVAAALLVAGVAAFGTQSPVEASVTVLHIDAGGSGLTTPDGTVWSADSGFVGGRASGTTRTVAGATDSSVSRTIRVGMSAYHLAIPNGTYQVTLTMAETYWQASGKRVFSSTAEGVPVATDLDIFAAVGRDRAIDRSVVVTVKDAQLDLAFTAKTDRATVSAIRVVPVQGPTPTPSPTATSPTPTPKPTTASPSPTTSTQPPTAATPSPTATPTPSPTRVASRSTLAFTPPTLVSPIVMPFPGGSSSLKLDVTKDYVLTLPTDQPLVNVKGITITGGHNVVMIGGAVDVQDGVSGERRGMYLSKATPTGTIFIEGVRILSSTQGSLTEGIDLASPGARVVLQNVALEGQLSGSYTTNHADAIQAWAGPAVLDIDGFSATTSYQGMFLLPNQHDPSPVYDWDLRHVSLSGQDAGYLAWRDSGAYAISVSDFYVTGSHIADGGVWPNPAAWSGVTYGAAPQDYASTAGPGYVSPGYR